MDLIGQIPDIDKVSPMTFPFPNTDVSLREDEIGDYLTVSEVLENAKLATIPSHNSKSAIDSSTLIALIIYYSRKGYSKEEIFEMMNINPMYVPFSKFNTTCEETIGNCLFALYNSNSFEDAIRKTLLMGGDTDTNCAIVGSMAEAIYGIGDELIEQTNKKIPEEFVKKLGSCIK